MTNSIEVKDFTGGINHITTPFSIYPTEAVELSNVVIDSNGMVTKNYILDKQIVPPKTLATDALQIAPKGSFLYDMTTAAADYYEKVRFYQGEDYILINGVPNRLKDGTKSSVFVVSPFVATAPQNTTLSTPNLAYTNVEQYTYYISYRNSAGFESPLVKLNTVNAHRTFNTNYTVETASTQTITVTAPPEVGDYGRIYRMGGNISFPSLVFQFNSSWVVTLNYAPVTTSAGTFTFSILDDKLGSYGTTWGGVQPPFLKYLVATKFGLAAANGSQVYLSMNKPDAWSALTSLNFGSTVVAIASVYRGFLVFTESSYLYMVSGSSLSTLSVDLISTDVGCSSNASVSEVGQHALIWVYKREFYLFNGSSVIEIEPNTYDYKFLLVEGYDKDITAISYEGSYLAGTNTGFVSLDLKNRYKPFIDFDLEAVFNIPQYASLLREFIFNHEHLMGTYKADGSFWSLKEYIYGDIEYVDAFPPTDGWALGAYTNPPIVDTDSTVCVYHGGFTGYLPVAPDPCSDDGAMLGNYTNSSISTVPVLYRSRYKGPKLSFNNQTTASKFTLMEVLYEGELIAKCYVDEVLVVTKEFISTEITTARIQIPAQSIRGNYAQVELIFNGKIYSYRLDAEMESTN